MKSFSQQEYNINFEDDKGRTQLHYTALKGDNSIVDLLIRNNININIIDREGFNALGLALKEEKTSVAYKLLN